MSPDKSVALTLRSEDRVLYLKKPACEVHAWIFLALFW